MNRRRLLFLLTAAASLVAVVCAAIGVASSTESSTGRDQLRSEGAVRDGFVPAAARGAGIGRYFVVMDAPSVADRARAGGPQSKTAQESATDAARTSLRGHGRRRRRRLHGGEDA